MAEAFAVINTWRGGTILEGIFSKEQDAENYIDSCDHNRFLEIDKYNLETGEFVHTVKISVHNT